MWIRLQGSSTSVIAQGSVPGVVKRDDGDDVSTDGR